jgi:hypothetical protein
MKNETFGPLESLSIDNAIEKIEDKIEEIEAELEDLITDE